MAKLFGFLIINTVALLITQAIVPGIIIESIQTAVIAAVVIGLINTFIKPVVQLIALPATILTLGLFALLINILFFMIAAELTPGFEVQSFFSALLGSLLLSVISSFLGSLTK